MSAIVNKETAALKRYSLWCVYLLFSLPPLTLNGSVLFLLTGSYNHQAMGNLSKLSIMSLEFFPLFRVGCLRCNSASCTVILPLTSREKHSSFQALFDPWICQGWRLKEKWLCILGLNDPVPQARFESETRIWIRTTATSLFSVLSACLE